MRRCPGGNVSSDRSLQTGTTARITKRIYRVIGMMNIEERNNNGKNIHNTVADEGARFRDCVACGMRRGALGGRDANRPR